MTTIPVGYGQARLVFQCVGLPWTSVTTFGYNPAVVDPSISAGAIYLECTDANGPCRAAAMLNQWSFLGVTVTEMLEEGPAGGESFATVTGSVAGQALPPNTAILARKNTAAGGRRNRGRLFIPPIFPDESNVSGPGVIAAPQLATLQTAWETLRANLALSGWPWVILHTEPPFLPTPITSISVQARLATQRRRMRR